ncbi:MAG TPA: helix-turn-helix domain-containing protein [Schlesneria sp.]|jgi:hypothetical protein
MESKKFLTAEEVAAEFGLDQAALQQFVDSGEVRALADRGTWKYRRDELQSLVEAGKISSDSLPGESLSDGNQVLTFDNSEDDLSYIELDETALAEQATMITKSEPEAEPLGDDWFVPSAATNMDAPVSSTSSDVAVYTGPEKKSTGETPVLAEKSDSDVQIAPDYQAAAADDLPADWLDAPEEAHTDSPVGSTSSDVAVYTGPEKNSTGETPVLAEKSDSDVQVAPDYQGAAADDLPADWLDAPDEAHADSAVGSTSSDVAVYTGPEKKSTGETPVLAEKSDSDVQIAPDYQATAADADSEETVWDDLAAEASDSHHSDSSVRLADDSDVQLMGLASSKLRTPAEDSGILLEDSRVKPDSGIALDAGQPDSGIALNTGAPDSGIALDAGDSGIALGHADSGLALGHADSGLALSGESGISFGLDSGLSLSGPESGLSLEGSGRSRGNAKTLADMDLADDDNDRTQTLNLMGEEDDSSYEINLDEGDATAELLLGDDDDLDDTSATVVRKGRPKAGSLSEAFDLDDETEVEDLEISEDLDAGSEAEVEEFDAEEEVFDASDETFSGDEVATLDGEEEDEDYLEPAGKSKKAAAGPKEPAWGAAMAVGLVACSLFLAANTLIIWTGVSSMWSGNDSEGPGGSLIQTFGDLIK